jgi:predicted transcriptional regulator
VPRQETDNTALSKKELEMVERIAKRDGISVDEAATNLGKAALARRVRKRTGKAPAKVYDMRRK